ncbi:histidinol-phosphate aminotransferase [Halovivax asiaticus JCM 14624]|uniref:Histidinol-phosphate aminotransferase n=1 Tax=Halovivax asiaticus JCM 14624 TaxID=1227490 RepID=M0BTA4_9EURY|nr:histidinol-phosphate transaminase [Halovivax asiaticus]ELZ14261.1 histidinol-phosphate aminotransferase [Halovivax asiaticus JCM 14624]
MQPRDLSTHATYEAGRGVEEVAREQGRDPDEFVTLSSNENPHGPAPAAVEAIRAAASSAHAYPKASHADLTDRLAEKWDVEPDQVWLGNGGDGAIDYLSRAMLEPDDTVLVPEPGFAYYAMSARFHHGRVRTYELSKDDDFEQDPDSLLAAAECERLLYLTSPHNPSGSTASLETVERIARETADETLVVVDEAYGEFAETESGVALIEGRDGFDARDDVAVIRTFSKAYGLAGVRLGYAVVPGAWADAYARVNTPFAASELACRAGLAAVDDTDHVEQTVDSARWARDYLASTVDAPAWPSGGNFVLFDVGDGAAVAAALQDRGVIVRDCTSFGLPGCIRVSCGTESETKRAADAIDEVLAARDGRSTAGEEVSHS